MNGMDQQFVPVRYDAMIHAIAECHRVDELKDLRDKAVALEIYAREAKNSDAERKAADIRLRAERRCGELLRDLNRTPPQKANPSGTRKDDPSPVAGSGSEYGGTLQRTGISSQDASRYQALASIPQREFDAALADPEVKPTTRYFVEHNKKPKRHAKKPEPQESPIPGAVLWLWTSARTFEREGYEKKDISALLDGMTDTMRNDMRRIAPQLSDFFNRLATALKVEVADALLTEAQ